MKFHIAKRSVHGIDEDYMEILMFVNTDNTDLIK